MNRITALFLVFCAFCVLQCYAEPIPIALPTSFDNVTQWMAMPSSRFGNRPPMPNHAGAPMPSERVQLMSFDEVRRDAVKGEFYPEANCFVPERTKSCAPWFIIAGAMKCGTTSMFSYLLDHPQVLPIPKNAKTPGGRNVLALKEVRFFNDPSYSKSMNENPNAEYEFYEIFEHIDPPAKGAPANSSFLVTGEGTPLYICQSGTAKRVYHALPHAKIIILLRNPVDRMHSEFWFKHGLASNVETLKTMDKDAWVTDLQLSFLDCIRTEIARFKHCGGLLWERNPTEENTRTVVDCISQIAAQGNREEFCRDNPVLCFPPRVAGGKCQPNTLKNSMYALQLQEWITMFGSEQLLVLKSEDFYENTPKVMAQVTEFLHLSEYDWSVISSQAFNIVNPGTLSAENHNLVSQNTGGLFVGGTNAEHVSERYPTLGIAARAEFEGFFAPYNRILGKMLNKAPFWT